MDSDHKEQTRILERDIENIGRRLDRHLEIYAQNNKRLMAVETNQAWLMRFFWAVSTPMLGGILYIILNIK